MRKIDKILRVQSIDGATIIKKMINDWSDTEIITFYHELKDLKETHVEMCKTISSAIKNGKQAL